MSLILTVIAPANGPDGDRMRMAFEASGGLIGRGHDNDWILPDPQRYLSVCHARVERREGYWYIEDLSTNGVYINDSRQPLSILPPRALNPGDRLRMGSYRMAVAIEGEAETAAADTAVEEMLIDHTPATAAVEATATQNATPATPTVAAATATATVSISASADAERRNRARPTAGQGGEIDAFCKGLGIDAARLPQQSHCSALYVAGLIMRETLAGARELAETQRRIRNDYGLPQPAAEPRFSELQQLSIEELMRQVMSEGREQALDSMHWLRDLFSNARRHDLALQSATRAAVGDYLQRLDPQRLEASGAAQERFRNLTEMPKNGLPLLLTEALVIAYGNALQNKP
jgi:predicted component of type VI protein secretion system